MTAAREAIVLPAIFITVAALGGLRIAATIQFVPPPLVSLVLAVLLAGTFIRTGVLAPERLMSAQRSALENISGLVVLVTLFAASVQVFTLVMPESGLLHAVFGIGLFVQLATSLAGVRGPRHLLRSLAILLGSAFVLRFVVLDNLYAADGGWAKRVLTVLVEGASLGSIQYHPTGMMTGYVAFGALVLYMIGLVLLPWAASRSAAAARDLEVPSRELMIALITVTLVASCACDTGTTASGASPAHSARARAREDALTRARVWHPPPVPVAEFDFTANPSGGFAPTDDVACRFTIEKLTGRTPKFHCEVADGRVLKVKYGAYNAELQAEIAGTRLLRALGFPADDMFVVRTVQCAGCPALPFQALRCRERIGVEPLCFIGGIDYAHVRAIAPAVIERRMEGTVIESDEDDGWSWYELDRIDPARGGSTRAEVDALRLIAIVLAHWDNKGPNQRLLCPHGRELPDGGCSEPIAMIQDLGATFGPERVDLHNWRTTPVWRDRATCTVSMSALPYGGATFDEERISEQGRLMLARLLDQLTDHQLTDLFTASRIVEYDEVSAEARDPRAWVKAFREKIKAIKEGPPCPAP